MATAAEKLIATAAAEVGYKEKATNANLYDKEANAGKGNWTKYAYELDQIGNIYNGKKNGYDWCDIFVDWCFIHTFGTDVGMSLLCQAYKGLGAGCGYSANYYKNKGQFHTSNPQPGDQIFFYTPSTGSVYHTGIVEKVDGGYVYTIEGNCSEMVKRMSYKTTYANIYGYGRPNWALADVKEEDESANDVEVNYQAKVLASAGLNCREKPVSGTILKTYKFNTVLTITKERSGWGYTGEGWVSLEYVEKVVPSTDPEEEVIHLDITRNELKQIIREVIEEEDPTFADISDVPSYFKDFMQHLLDDDIVNGGTDKKVCATDLNLRMSTIKAAIIAARYHDTHPAGNVHGEAAATFE